MDAEWLALSDAAVSCGLNRERLLRLVQAGVIEGRRNLTGRWEVRRRSIERYRTQRNSTRDPAELNGRRGWREGERIVGGVQRAARDRST